MSSGSSIVPHAKYLSSNSFFELHIYFKLASKFVGFHKASSWPLVLVSPLIPPLFHLLDPYLLKPFPPSIPNFYPSVSYTLCYSPIIVRFTWVVGSQAFTCFSHSPFIFVMPFFVPSFPFPLTPCLCMKLSALVFQPPSTFTLPIFYYLAFGPSTLFLLFLFANVYTVHVWVA